MPYASIVYQYEILVPYSVTFFIKMWTMLKTIYESIQAIHIMAYNVYCDNGIIMIGLGTERGQATHTCVICLT